MGIWAKIFGEKVDPVEKYRNEKAKGVRVSAVLENGRNTNPVEYRPIVKIYDDFGDVTYLADEWLRNFRKTLFEEGFLEKNGEMSRIWAPDKIVSLEVEYFETDWVIKFRN